MLHGSLFVHCSGSPKEAATTAASLHNASHICHCCFLSQCVSTMANMSLQEVAAQAQHPCMLFQLYVIRDRQIVEGWVRQAEAAGYKALMITVDAPRLGRREADERNRCVAAAGCRTSPLKRFRRMLCCCFLLDIARHPMHACIICRCESASTSCHQHTANEQTVCSLDDKLAPVRHFSRVLSAARCRFRLPDHLHMANLQVLAEKRAAGQPGSTALLDARDSSHSSGLFELFAREVDDTLTWEAIPWLRSITKLPIYIKVGVMGVMIGSE